MEITLLELSLFEVHTNNGHRANSLKACFQQVNDFTNQNQMCHDRAKIAWQAQVSSGSFCLIFQ